jgi:nucleoid DNA-binding protein
MNELIQQLVEKANLSQEQAEKSLEVIKEYIMAKLPPMMQPMVENFLGQQNQED